ncbi:MAG: hypothetical protein GY733_20310 [bacterium]|nr:hypothetical protein [bacterium]
MWIPALAIVALASVCASSPIVERSCVEAVRTSLGDTPPKGPPWQLTYREARRSALRSGTPVFVYFTKTY